MAFTPDGMFYLSKGDYAPSMDTLGGAARGMLGLQNKEEAVNTILEGADYSTPESRRAALDQIRSIDPDRWATLNKQNQDYETQELALTKGYNTPVLKAEWRLDVGKNFTALYASENLPGQPKDLDTRTKMIKYLNRLVSAGTIKNQIKKDWMKDYDLTYKAKGEAYVTTNASRSGNKSSNLISSKDTFGGYGTNSKSPKVTYNSAKAQQDRLLKEFHSLEDVANAGYKANPGALNEIHAAKIKRRDDLQAQINALDAKVKEEASAPYQVDATTLFETNSDKYK